VLAKQPAALMLSFGALAPFAPRIRQSGVPLICQVQSMRHAREAVDAGADVIVAQGHEAGGHSGSRSTFTLVPEVAGFLADVSPDTLLVAAGGVADGRALAAALMLGADGVLMGTRLVASSEALIPAEFQAAIVAADGDTSMKTAVVDIVRGYHWPDDIKVRVLKNRFVSTWHGREDALAEAQTNAVERERYWSAFRGGDAQNSGVLAGEAAGLIREVKPAARIVEDMVDEAQRILGGAAQFVG
jgi:nitronate monooxygenase